MEELYYKLIGNAPKLITDADISFYNTDKINEIMNNMAKLDPETPQQYLSRKLQESKLVTKNEPKKTKEPNCINLPPEIWKALDSFIIEYNEKTFVKLSRNMAIEMACKELLTKHNVKW